MKDRMIEDLETLQKAFAALTKHPRRERARRTTERGQLLRLLRKMGVSFDTEDGAVVVGDSEIGASLYFVFDLEGRFDSLDTTNHRKGTTTSIPRIERGTRRAKG